MSFSFRNYENLSEALLGGLHRLPDNLDVVVGIPRSGLVAANILALYLNLPLTDLDGLVEKRLIASGPRGSGVRTIAPGDRVLVIDDSVGHGTQMTGARRRLRALEGQYDLTYAAVYVTPEARHLVDVAFEVVPWGRAFSWNVLHHPALQEWCLVVDGVITGPDVDEELPTRPLVRPTSRVGWLISQRSESERGPVESWLQHHRISYDHLVLRSPGGPVGAGFKGRVYRRTDANLLIEGNSRNTRRVAWYAGRPVLDWFRQRLVAPPLAVRLARTTPTALVEGAMREFSPRGK